MQYIVWKLTVRSHQRQNRVVIDLDAVAIVLIARELLCTGVGVRDVETRLVQSVPSHHQSHAVRHKLAHDLIAVDGEFNRLPAVLSERAFQCLKVFFTQLLLENRDVLQCHLRSELILQSVDVDEDAVEFFLVFVELEEVVGGLCGTKCKKRPRDFGID